VRKPECCKKPGDERDICKWTRGSRREGREAPQDCLLWAYAIQVEGCINVGNWSDCDTKMDKGFELRINGKGGFYLCEGCAPNGRRTFGTSEIGLGEVVTMEWNGRNDQEGCRCTVNGVSGSTSIQIVGEDTDIGFERRKGLACRCPFKCHPYN